MTDTEGSRSIRGVTGISNARRMEHPEKQVFCLRSAILAQYKLKSMIVQLRHPVMGEPLVQSWTTKNVQLFQIRLEFSYTYFSN